MFQNNKVLLYSAGNTYPVISHNGKEYEKEYNGIILLYTRN